ncbi:amidohydrolase [Parasediminibacterium sp. JCM 36343]|uniref:amidohydrolase n=1 Tax=Parasediminibacterium sp. JCM 36343 TaxID=3374279 RepID=UPI00397CA576
MRKYTWLFIITAFLLCHDLYGQYPLVKQLVDADSLRLVEIYKDIHQHPELGFTEKRTSAIVAKELQALGYDVVTGLGKTGVAGVLHNGDGPVVMYRADMDALPMKETTGLPYASTETTKKVDGTVVPLMHACGHDAHVTWLLGVAKVMVNMKNIWKGTLVFVAQPAEEYIQGANAMVKDNMYAKGVPLPDYLFGMHTTPYAVGYVENIAGNRMAGSTGMEVIFNGIGGHGSAPHLAKDPVIMAATAILEYQAIVNRSISALNPHVITVGSVEAGTVANIIPTTATLKITTRWYNDADRDLMVNGINRVDSSIAFANNLPPDLYPTVKMGGSVYPVKNDTAMVDKINAGLKKNLPNIKQITGTPPTMGAEDFPLLVINSKKNPVYDFMFVGIGNPEVCAKHSKSGKAYPYNNHNPNFAVDLSAIPLGAIIGSNVLLELFK